LEEINIIAIGRRIKELKEKSGHSFEKIGASIGGSGQTVINLVNAKTKNPSIQTLENLAKYFDVSPQYLIYGKEPQIENFVSEPAPIFGYQSKHIRSLLEKNKSMELDIRDLNEEIKELKDENKLLKRNTERLLNELDQLSPARPHQSG